MLVHMSRLLFDVHSFLQFSQPIKTLKKCVDDNKIHICSMNSNLEPPKLVKNEKRYGRKTKPDTSYSEDLYSGDEESLSESRTESRTSMKMTNGVSEKHEEETHQKVSRAIVEYMKLLSLLDAFSGGSRGVHWVQMNPVCQPTVPWIFWNIQKNILSKLYWDLHKKKAPPLQILDNEPTTSWYTVFFWNIQENILSKLYWDLQKLHTPFFKSWIRHWPCYILLAKKV